MFTILLAVALTCQGAATEPTGKGPLTAAQLKALNDQINRRASDPAYQARVQRDKAAERAHYQRYRAEYAASAPARDAARRERAAAQARADAAAQAQAQADYRAMLPFLMEQQRQQLQRMSDIERNQALHRLATAAEYEAQTNKQRADYLAWWLMQHPSK
jgi:hypothetical protein